jgi:hypothetical protein
VRGRNARHGLPDRLLRSRAVDIVYQSPSFTLETRNPSVATATNNKGPVAKAPRIAKSRGRIGAKAPKRHRRRTCRGQIRPAGIPPWGLVTTIAGSQSDHRYNGITDCFQVRTSSMDMGSVSLMLVRALVYKHRFWRTECGLDG